MGNIFTNMGYLDLFVSYATFSALLILHILLFFAVFILPMYYFVIHRKKMYIFDPTIKIGFLLLLTYSVINVRNLFIGYNINDYKQSLIDFSTIRGTNATEIISFITILNIDMLNLFVLILFNFGNKTTESSNKSIIHTYVSPEEYDVEKNNAFVIVCHNSSDKITDTIKSLLIKVPPECIYVSDNGSSSEEVDKTKKLCDTLLVNYLYFEMGNKTKSQFATINVIKINNKNIKYVTLIDDDTHLPYEWSFKHVQTYFENDLDVVAVAFPLCVKNKVNFVTECQNFEYLMSSHAKIMQNSISSCMFPSGAFGVWDIDYLLDIMLKHNSVFNGEDFQLGMLSRTMYQTKSMISNKLFTNSPKIATCSHIFISTITPIHWFHTTDLPFGNMFEKCKCGEGSLYIQRARGWDLTRQRFFVKYLSILFSREKLCFNTFWIKILYFNEILLVINDWCGFFYIFIYGILGGKWLQISRSLVLSSCWTLPILLVVRYFVLGKFKIPIFVILFYTIFYKLIMNTLVKIDCMFNNFIFYSSLKSPKVIHKQLQNVDTFNIFLNYWKKYITTTDHPIECATILSSVQKTDRTSITFNDDIISNISYPNALLKINGTPLYANRKFSTISLANTDSDN